MPIGTTQFRLFRRKIKTGQDDDSGNYTWSHAEPVLQQLFERTNAEIEMAKAFRNLDLPKTEWRDVSIVLEE